MNRLILAIGALIAIIPGLSQLKNIDMLPHFWANSNLIAGVVTSVLCFLLVLIYYALRGKLNSSPRAKIIRWSISTFVLFLITIISFSILRGHCLFNDDQGDIAFIPIFVDYDTATKIDDPPTSGSREAWVRIDKARNVNQIVGDSPKNVIFLHLTMVVFFLLYLLLFVFLITPVMLLGFHLAPTLATPPKGET